MIELRLFSSVILELLKAVLYRNNRNGQKIA